MHFSLLARTSKTVLRGLSTLSWTRPMVGSFPSIRGLVPASTLVKVVTVTSEFCNPTQSRINSCPLTLVWPAFSTRFGPCLEIHLLHGSSFTNNYMRCVVSFCRPKKISLLLLRWCISNAVVCLRETLARDDQSPAIRTTLNDLDELILCFL